MNKARVRRRKAERPQEILQAAFDAFSTHGFAATRLDDIAGRAGITKGTIYVYFPSKEDLFIATLKAKTRSLFEHLATLSADPDMPAFDVLRRHMDFVLDLLVEDPCGRDILRILLAESRRFPTVVDRWYVETLEPALNALRSVLKRGVDRGEFRATAITDFPQLIMAPIVLLSTWYGLFGDRRPIDLPRFFEAAMDVIARGLLQPPDLQDALTTSCAPDAARGQS